jgi:26S proteasome regulatory subunit N2
LDEPEQVASVFENLIRSNNILMAYQLGFDLYESAAQQFLHKVSNLLKVLVNIPQPMETDVSKPMASDDVKIEEQTVLIADSSKVVRIGQKLNIFRYNHHTKHCLCP